MISLRAYNQEIEQLIDNGQYDEAIAHCKHILKKFPKFTNTYRNLGKALLEQKKYPDAQDIFNRVLSVFPDDFISHVGQSIIHEDQNNIDLAIWHMEQAFDVQPSNVAIQDELKRLFKLRDGDQPQKIRLTRGALVRMYARGELYQQAIEEIEKILEQDSKRLDLEVILAKMMYASGNTSEAESIGKQILERVPFCYEINQLLLDIMQNKMDSDGAQIYRSRLIDLDPYYHFENKMNIDESVSDLKIKLERLQYSPVNNEDIVPSWSDSAEINTETLDTDSDWLSQLEPNSLVESNNVTSSAPELSVEGMSDIKLPDWMQQAGWVNAGDDQFYREENQSVSPSDVESEVQINKIRMPDWLYEDQNEEASEEETLNTSQEQEFPFPVHQNHLSGADLASLFSELKEGSMNDNLINNNDEENTPIHSSDWLSQFSGSDEIQNSDSDSNEIPDWLKDFEADQEVTKNDSQFVPEWLKTLQSQVEPVSQQDFSDEESSLEKSDLFQSTMQEKETFENLHNQDTTLEETISDFSNNWEKTEIPSDIEQTPSPLSSEGITIDEVSKDESSSEDVVPDWVKTVLATSSILDEEPSESTSPSNTSPLVMEENRTIQSSVLSETEDQAELTNEGAISQQTNDDLLDWLRGLKEDEEEIVHNEVLSDQMAVEENVISDHLIEESISEPDKFEQKEENNEIDQFEEMPTPAVQVTPASVQSGNIDMEPTPAMETNFDDTVEPVDHEDDYSELSALFSEKTFEHLSEIVDKLVDQGHNVEQLLDFSKVSSGDHIEDYRFWQFFGDTLAEKNKLSDALSAYQKAEELLLQSH